MAGNARASQELPLQKRIAVLADEAAEVARKARKHRQSLKGSNFYADKLVELRADATNAFRDLSNRSVGDTAALAELIETCFSASATFKHRLEAKRALRFELNTTWKDPKTAATETQEELFPLSLLAQTRRGYLVAVARQLNGCYGAGWYDASAVMMRRLLETSIIEAFEGRGLAARIKNEKGDFLQLSDLIDTALAEAAWNLSKNTRKYLPSVRDVGHMSAHSRYFLAQKSDVDKVRLGCRVAVEEFLRLGGLL